MRGSRGGGPRAARTPGKLRSVAPRTMRIGSGLATGALMLWAGAAAPQQVTPGAGSLLQELKPLEAPAPSIKAPDLDLEQPAAAQLPPSEPFAVRQIQLRGNTRFDEATLHALVSDAEGLSLTLPELGARISRITDYYHAHGFPLARAFIPAQSIREGVVGVEILEARYGQVELANQSRAADRLLQSTMAGLRPGEPIAQAPLDHALLLLADIPGVNAGATLQPGDGRGSSDLLVQAATAPRLAGTVSVDNNGNRYTGRVRASAELDVYEPLGQGDLLDLSVLTSGRDLNYGRGSYDLLLNGRGTRVGGAFSALHYSLGDPLEALEGHGTAQVGSLWTRQVLVRSRDLNLYAQLEFDHKELRDRIDVTALRTDRHVDLGTASLSLDWRDGLLGGGGNSAGVQWLRGHVKFDDAAAQLADAATARTAGSFSQAILSLTRVQVLRARDSLYLSLTGQWASGNLDASQKFVAGGRYTVRAYDMSAASGDTGLLACAEWRHDLVADAYGHWQLLGFVEAEHVTVNKDVWTGGGNDATLRGAGLGFNWANRHRWRASGSLAARLGQAPALVGSSARLRGWVEVSKAF